MFATLLLFKKKKCNQLWQGFSHRDAKHVTDDKVESREKEREGQTEAYYSFASSNILTALDIICQPYSFKSRANRQSKHDEN